MPLINRQSERFGKRFSVINRIDRLEPRTLFTGYVPSTVASFATSNGATPDGGMVVDAGGNLYGTTSAGGTAGDGSVFEIAAGATTITTVASFTGTNGADPMGTLYRDSAGTLWGTTKLGGANNAGSIFKIVSGSTTITTVASFTGSGPYYPTGNLVADSAGDLFGTASQGGSGEGGIFELPFNASSVTTVATATNGTPQPDLSIDSAGNLYGSSALGGSSYYGSVFKVVKSSNRITTLVAFTNGPLTPTPGYEPGSGLVVDSSGNIFGELYAQSSSVGMGSLFEIQGTSLTQLAYFSSSTGVNPSGGLVADSAGDLFGTTSTGLFEYSHSKITSTANGFYGTPHGRLLIDSAGDLTGDTSNGGTANVGLIYKLTPSLSCSFTQYPTTATAGVPFSPVVKVALLDASGNVMTSSSATVTLSASYGTLMGTTSVAAVNGVATFTGVSSTTAGSTALTASAAGFVQGTVPTVTVSPAGAAKLQFQSTVPNAVAGQPIGGSSPLTVRLLDAYGNVVSGPRYDSVSIALASTTGSATLSGTTTLAMNGTSVTFTGVSAAAAGTGYTLIATDNTYPANSAATSSVFTIVPQAFQFSMVYNFDGTDSGNPNGPLLFDSAGNIYGTTGVGGLNNSGTVYEIPVGGSVSPTYYNGVGSGGTRPIGNLVADKAGNLYGADALSIFKIPVGSTTPVTIGTFGSAFDSPDGQIAVDPAGDVFGATYNGGTYRYGSIFEIPSGGSLTVLYSFQDADDGYEPEGGVQIDSNGNLFGTTTGSAIGGIIFEIPAGKTTPVTLATNNGGFNSGLTIDSAGNLYGTTGYPGIPNTIFELVKGASTLTTLATFDGNDGSSPYSPPIIDSAGDLFGITPAGGTSGLGTFYELPHGQSAPIAYYNFNTASGTDSSNFSASSSLAFDSQGNLWGVAYSNGSAGYGTLFEISKNTSLTVSGTTYLRMDADHVQVDVYNNSTGTGTPSQQVPLDSLLAIDVSYSSPTATLTIDCSAGIPIPPGGLNYAGTANLTLIGTTGNDSVATSSGSVMIDGIPISETAPITFVPNGGSDALSVSTASFTLGSPFLSTGTSEKFSSLVVGTTGAVDASASLANGRSDLLIVGALSVGGRLNLGASEMDISGSTLPAVNSLLQLGFNQGAWSGSGIFSSAAAADSTHLTSLGAIQNNQSGTPLFGSTKLFHGGIPGASDVLIGYTYFGDANLDGKVDGSDYSLIDNGYLQHLTRWFNGDFNYDGVVDGSDYTLIDNAFNTQGTNLATQISQEPMASKLVSSAARPAAIFAEDQSVLQNSWSAGSNNLATLIFSTDTDDLLKRHKFSRRPILV